MNHKSLTRTIAWADRPSVWRGIRQIDWRWDVEAALSRIPGLIPVRTVEDAVDAKGSE